MIARVVRVNSEDDLDSSMESGRFFFSGRLSVREEVRIGAAPFETTNYSDGEGERMWKLTKIPLDDKDGRF